MKLSLSILRQYLKFQLGAAVFSGFARCLVQYFYFFFKDKEAHHVHAKTYNSKIHSRILILDHSMLSAVPKISVQMIPKNKDPLTGYSVKNDPFLGSNFLSLNRDQDRLQKYWAIITDDIVPKYFNTLESTSVLSSYKERPHIIILMQKDVWLMNINGKGQLSIIAEKIFFPK